MKTPNRSNGRGICQQNWEFSMFVIDTRNDFFSVQDADIFWHHKQMKAPREE